MPRTVGTETGWLPSGSVKQAKKSAEMTAHAFSQLVGYSSFGQVWHKVSEDRYEASSPAGTVHAVVARARTDAGETEATNQMRRGMQS
jgi:hypothetical protein